VKLESLLTQKKAAVLERWRDLIVQTYPADAYKFLKREKDRFNNPIGYTITRGTEGIYDALIQGSASNVLSSTVDSIVKIRAVQDFSASQAVAFVFLLKKSIREQLAAEMRENGFSEQLLTFESKIDELALLTFYSYMRCREKIHDIRVDEVKNGLFKLRQRVNLRDSDGPPPDVDAADSKKSM
jgi:hypothetical protein